VRAELVAQAGALAVEWPEEHVASQAGCHTAGPTVAAAAGHGSRDIARMTACPGEAGQAAEARARGQQRERGQAQGR
jgi:hypothetical protein